MKKLLSFVLILAVFSLFSCSEVPEGNKDVDLVLLSDMSVVLYEGQSYQITSSILPSDAENKTLTWISSRPEVCAVNDGLLSALSEGVSVVMAKAHNGKTASVRVTVKKIEDIRAIVLSNIELSLEPGESHTLSASVQPLTNSSDLPIIWSTTDDSVATVDSDGNVTAVNKGACFIGANIPGVARAVCKVSVSDGEMDLSSIVSVSVEGIPQSYTRIEEGKTVAKGEITSCDIESELAPNGKIRITLKIHGNKTFDIGGATGKKTLLATARIYEIIGEEEVYRFAYFCTSGEVKVGDEFIFIPFIYYDLNGNGYAVGDVMDEAIFAFEVEIKPEQRMVKVVLDYGEGETINEYD